MNVCKDMPLTTPAIPTQKYWMIVFHILFRTTIPPRKHTIKNISPKRQKSNCFLQNHVKIYTVFHTVTTVKIGNTVCVRNNVTATVTSRRQNNRLYHHFNAIYCFSNKKRGTTCPPCRIRMRSCCRYWIVGNEQSTHCEWRLPPAPSSDCLQCLPSTAQVCYA